MTAGQLKRRILLATAARSIRRAGCWFVDIPRTSSTSIKSELSAAFGPLFAKSDGARARPERLIRDHLTAAQARDAVGYRTWNAIFTFTLVRNPWDRMLSMYLYRRQAGEIPDEMTFSTYIELLAANRGHGIFRYPGHHAPCSAFIADADGVEIVSFVGRYERRGAELATIGERIGVPGLGQAHLYSTRASAHYSDYYTPTTKDIVAEVWAADVDRFGYAFEPPVQAAARPATDETPRTPPRRGQHT